MRRACARIGPLASLAAATQARAADAALFSSASVLELQPNWQWVAGAAVAGLVVGFALGWRVLDRRIRKKYGGLKIY